MKPEMDLVQLERSLKGAPAAIILALILHGGPQTAKTLCRHTAYSDKVVRRGLARLAEMGVVFYDSDLRAWYLVTKTTLLRQLQRGLLPTSAPVRPGPPPVVKLSTELSTSQLPGEDSTATGEKFTAGGQSCVEETAVDVDPVGEDFTAAGEEFTAGGQSCVEESAIDADPVGEDSAAMLEVSTSGGEVSTREVVDLSSSRGPLNSITKIPDPDQEKENKQIAYKNRRNRRQRGDKGQKVLEEWLVRGGIGRNSPKMREIVAADPDLETVKAHVLERLAWTAGLIPGTVDYKPGLLIFKLLNDYPPPPMRCEDCLSRPDKLGMCACDYESLIHR